MKIIVVVVFVPNTKTKIQNVMAVQKKTETLVGLSELSPKRNENQVPNNCTVQDKIQ